MRSSAASPGIRPRRIGDQSASLYVRPHFRVQWYVASHLRIGIAVDGPRLVPPDCAGERRVRTSGELDARTPSR
eukprot:9084391-Alexandrium_andersonii.AAC.1